MFNFVYLHVGSVLSEIDLQIPWPRQFETSQHLHVNHPLNFNVPFAMFLLLFYISPLCIVTLKFLQ